MAIDSRGEFGGLKMNEADRHTESYLSASSKIDFHIAIIPTKPEFNRNRLSSVDCVGVELIYLNLS